TRGAVPRPRGVARAAGPPAHRAGPLDRVGPADGRPRRRHLHRGRPGHGPGRAHPGDGRRGDGVTGLSAADAEGVAGVADALRMQADGDVAKGGDQGEVVVLPERFAVSPGHGRFYPVTPSRFNDERPYVEPGDLLREVRHGGASIPVRSPFRGWVMAHLAWEGELVTPGQILLSLRPFSPPPTPRPPTPQTRA